MVSLSTRPLSWSSENSNVAHLFRGEVFPAPHRNFPVRRGGQATGNPKRNERNHVQIADRAPRTFPFADRCLRVFGDVLSSAQFRENKFRIANGFGREAS